MPLSGDTRDATFGDPTIIPGPMLPLLPITAAALIAFLASSPWISGIASSLSDGDEMAFRAAFSAIRDDRWSDARAAAARGRNDTARDLVRWHLVINRNTGATFEEIAAFLKSRPAWPYRARMIERAEEAMPADLPPARVAEWFDSYPPRSIEGRSRQISALAATGRGAEAKAKARETWRGTAMSAAEERRFLDAHGSLLEAGDHSARARDRLWADDTAAAARLLDRLSPGERALAEARIRLQRRQAGVDQAIKAVPSSLRDAPGLQFDRLRWRRQADLDEGARELLASQPEDLVRPEKWWRERAILTRRALHDGAVSAAYELASGHDGLDDVTLAEARWLAGYIAMRFLHEHELAARHFRALYEDVSTPISRARGAYWSGRAFDAMDRREEAGRWYRRAAEHGTTFYGQLAARRLGLDAAMLTPQTPPSTETVERFHGGDLVRATRILGELGENRRIYPFVDALYEQSESVQQKMLVAQLAAYLGRPDIAVIVARRAAADGDVLVSDGYPIVDLDPGAAPEPALVLALIRQESGFNPVAGSPAGAVGMMQLLPATAKRMAQRLGVPFDRYRLISDPSYNIRLGRAFLDELLRRYDGAYPMALAAYNAGPGRVDAWLDELGDPRRERDFDMVDWIELIPYRETRNYVQRVLEALVVYRATIDVPVDPAAADAAERGWCLFACGSTG